MERRPESLLSIDANPSVGSRRYRRSSCRGSGRRAGDDVLRTVVRVLLVNVFVTIRSC